jgi:ADP-ribose pyrophosphatase YjhB (NUDIX family)
MKKEKLYYLGENPAVDVINLIPNGEIFDVLLISRGGITNHNQLALVGGFIDSNNKKGELFSPKESPAEAAVREVEEETKLKLNPQNLLFVGYYNDKNRDPRSDENSFVSSTVFVHFWEEKDWAQQKLQMKPSDGEKAIHLVSLPSILRKEHALAFDHQIIIENAYQKLLHKQKTGLPIEPCSSLHQPKIKL